MLYHCELTILNFVEFGEYFECSIDGGDSRNLILALEYGQVYT